MITIIMPEWLVYYLSALLIISLGLTVYQIVLNYKLLRLNK